MWLHCVSASPAMWMAATASPTSSRGKVLTVPEMVARTPAGAEVARSPQSASTPDSAATPSPVRTQDVNCCQKASLVLENVQIEVLKEVCPLLN